MNQTLIAICQDIERKFKEPVKCTSKDNILRVRVNGSVDYKKLAEYPIKEMSIYTNEYITNLPDTLKLLKIYDSYNLPFQTELPKNLNVLYLGNSFNYPLPYLPESLLILKIGDMFNQEIELPDNLEVLSLGSSFKKPIVKLPKKLKKLTIKGNYPHFLPVHKIKLDFIDVYGTQNKDIITEILSQKICQKMKSIFRDSIDCHSNKTGVSIIINGQLDYEKLSKFPIHSLHINTKQKITHLPKNLHHLFVSDLYSDKLPDIPKTLNTLIIGNSFNNILPKLPESLESLILGDSFNQSLGDLPKKLKVLILGSSYEKPLENLPSSLVKLEIKSHSKFFDKKVFQNSSTQSNKIQSFNENMIQKNNDINSVCEDIIYSLNKNLRNHPNKIRCYSGQISVIVNDIVDFKKLSNFHQIKLLEINVSQPISNLPFNLETLIIGDNYDGPIDVSILPNTLKKLDIGDSFNNELPALPINLTYLHIGNSYDYEIPQILPNSLQYLFIGDSFNSALPNELPDTLRVLFIGNKFNQELPSGLPKSLEELYLGDSFNHELRSTYLPNSIKVIKLGNSYSQHLPQSLPTNLEKLELGLRFIHELPDVLPNNLKSLKIYSIYFDKPLPNLPDSLEKLTLGIVFNHELPSQLPNNLRVLDLKYKFNQKLPDKLPEQLEKLCLGNSFNHVIPRLPSSITKVELLNKNYSHILNFNNIPIWFETVKSLNQRIPENISKLSIRANKKIYDFEGEHLLQYITFHNTLFDIRNKFNGKSIDQLMQLGFLTFDYNENIVSLNGQHLENELYDEIKTKLGISENQESSSYNTNINVQNVGNIIKYYNTSKSFNSIKQNSNNNNISRLPRELPPYPELNLYNIPYENLPPPPELL